jgi:hypothetical protein
VLHGLGLELRLEPRTPHSSADPAGDRAADETR